MEKFSLTLYLEINKSHCVFFVGESNDQNHFKIIYHLEIPLKGIESNRISNLNKAFHLIKENVYIIEQKFNHTFKEIVLVLENFNLSFINLSGYKKLNGSQVLRENITYILNVLKSYIDKIESKKTVLHIFNSKFHLDGKKIDNLPVGLFGDFYSHELSFALIDTKDYKNLHSIFDMCNLRIRKILLKSFVKGANLSDNNINIDTFFDIKIYDTSSKIFYFENNSLKFEQDFTFGYNIILRDISKITSLKISNVKSILNKFEFNKEIFKDDDFIEELFFKDETYRKIKKKLIYDIILARISEIFTLMISKNINLNYYKKTTKVIFFELNNQFQIKGLGEMYKNIFSLNGAFEVKFFDNSSPLSMLNTANKLVHYGWKKEAIPVAQTKKSLISRFFEAIFG